jgi:hypothetical protein
MDSISGAGEVVVGNGAAKRSDDAGRANNATVVVVSIIVAILLVLLGLISCDELVEGLRGGPPSAESNRPLPARPRLRPRQAAATT